MLLKPKNTKYRKAHKGRVYGYKYDECHFGSFGLKSTEAGRISANQLDAAIKVIRKKMKKVGKVWVRIYPNIPVTKKPTEVRMGKGKGSVDKWVCRIKEDKILFEIDRVNLKIAKEIFKLASYKLPLKTKVVIRKDGK